MLRQLVASVTIAALASAGCGGRAWPGAATTVADPAFAAAQHPIATVDILPLDLAVWTEAGVTASPTDLRGRVETRIMNTALDALSRRGFGIQTLIDWNGEASGTVVLARPDLLATVATLARYGAAVEEHRGSLPGAALPAKLGEVTGADATLYVGGWAYVAAHRESTGSKVAKGVAIAVVAVALIGIVLVIAAASKDSSSSSSSPGKSRTSKQRSGGAAVRDHREDVISETRDHRSTVPVIRDHRSSAPVVRDHRSAPVVRDHRSSSDATPALRDHRSATTRSPGRDIAVDLSWMTDVEIDGHVDPELDPSWRAQQPIQNLGNDSQLYLEMTLVDNRTGLVLWHAHQGFPANAAKPADMERAARVLLASLPAH